MTADTVRPHQFLMMTDLGLEGLTEVLDLAARVKDDPASVAGDLAGRKIGLFFQKPSTRTRVSCETAVVDLGAHPVVMKQDEVGLGKREAVQDVARTLDRYLDLLAFRVFDHADLDSLSDHATAPVVNLLSDISHPCQGLADLQTVAEHRPLEGTKLTYLGDGNNVAHSLLLGGAMVAMHVRVVGPESFAPDPAIVAAAEAIAVDTGGSVTVGTEPSLVEGSDVVYTDVWASMGQESEALERRALFQPYRVDLELFEAAGPEAVFMHCLPAHRDEEVTDAVIEHERSAVFDQAENRMHAFKALVLQLLG